MPSPLSGFARAGDAMLHPAIRGALAVLVLNDHVFKRLAPGLVTGKLSDVCGLVFFPALLWSLLELARRRPLALRACVACVILTGVVFSLTKTVPAAADLYASAIAALQLRPGGRVSFVVDPTDLVALPALAVPLLVARRRARRAP